MTSWQSRGSFSRRPERVDPAALSLPVSRPPLLRCRHVGHDFKKELHEGREADLESGCAAANGVGEGGDVGGGQVEAENPSPGPVSPPASRGNHDERGQKQEQSLWVEYNRILSLYLREIR